MVGDKFLDLYDLNHLYGVEMTDENVSEVVAIIAGRGRTE
jgi:uncharacterized protein (DUF697 family)